MRDKELSQIENTGWQRAAVLGANDGIISTASLILGVAATHASHQSILIVGISGLVAGALSMASGEYVSVSSQADTEHAALVKERAEIAADATSEHRELAAIYMQRGLNLDLATQVAQQLMAHDALGAHARDELGISERNTARPLQAAMASASSFAMGAILPLLIAVFASSKYLIPLIPCVALITLAFLGGLAAYVGKANILRGMLRLTFWGALAMGVTAAVGTLFGPMG
ncbi:VIT1/CCC1 transporter family protein [Andreprevotia chitinilytica]|uniref:VIT1/CCC1 transporter family protein n=1 Tax=Andreprevotia chitinilytica TaxID=396808 RepID=UPI00054D9878|nr:VIT family protein [Andreprevotia chitinilytica]